MSLDVHLSRKKYVSYEKGAEPTKENEEVYWANITHNLGEMADKAGIYKALWRPEEIKAKDIIEVVEVGLIDLKSRPEYFKQFNNPNGWGMYEHFVHFVEEYLGALKEHPECLIEVSI